MKKIFLTVLFLSFAFFAVHSQTGVIRGAAGNVELLYPGTEAFLPAHSGRPVIAGTVVSTGIRSRTQIRIGSSEIFMRPMTQVSIIEITIWEDSEIIIISLESGNIQIVSRPPEGVSVLTTVQTASATAVVTARDFEASAEGEFSSANGNVRLTNAKGSVTVPGTFRTHTDAGGGFVNPMQDTMSQLSPLTPSWVGEAGERNGTIKNWGIGNLEAIVIYR